MKRDHNRRMMLKSSILGAITIGIPNVIYCNNKNNSQIYLTESKTGSRRYPSLDDAIVSEMVGVCHFNFDRVKELVAIRPELAKASWDWAYGDTETALGAASHVGRRDIALFLIQNGARPDLFTHAMLGHHDIVKSIVEACPDVKNFAGPHGISLLRHAKSGLRLKDTLSTEQINNCEKTIAFVEGISKTDSITDSLKLSDQEKELYLGDYLYGDGPDDGVSVKLNMMKNLSLGKLGKSGGGLIQIKPNLFKYNGTSSVDISFQKENGNIVSVRIEEPDLTITAKKV